ncbi:MAG: hypothetical protein AAGA91_13055 [Pseudomonadota bacterium]
MYKFVGLLPLARSAANDAVFDDCPTHADKDLQNSPRDSGTVTEPQKAAGGQRVCALTWSGEVMVPAFCVGALLLDLKNDGH